MSSSADDDGDQNVIVVRTVAQEASNFGSFIEQDVNNPEKNTTSYLMQSNTTAAANAANKNKVKQTNYATDDIQFGFVNPEALDDSSYNQNNQLLASKGKK